MRNLFTIQNGKRYLSIILGNLLITGAYAFITVPNRIVNGGVTSFSMILEEVTSINLTYLVDFITILLLLLCYIFLGKTFFTGTVFSCICYLVFFSILHSTGLALTCRLPWHGGRRNHCRIRILFLHQCKVHSRRIRCSGPDFNKKIRKSISHLACI